MFEDAGLQQLIDTFDFNICISLSRSRNYCLQIISYNMDCMCSARSGSELSFTTNTYTPGFDINYEDTTNILEEVEADYLQFKENIKSDLCSSTRKDINPVKSIGNQETTIGTLLEKILKKPSSRKREKLETSNVLNSTYAVGEKAHKQEFTKRLNKKKEKLVQHKPKVDGVGNSTFKIQENTTFVLYNNNQIERDAKSERFSNSKSKQNKDESASKELKFSLTATEIRDRCRISIVCRNNTIAFEGHTF